jgi:hypothetical protein
MKRSIQWNKKAHKTAWLIFALLILSETNVSRADGAQTGTPNYEFLFSFRHDDIVTCAAFSRDGRWLATGSELGTVLVTNIESKKEIAIKNPDSRDNGVVGLRFSEDGQFLVVGGYGNQKGGGEIRILRTSDYSTVMSLDVPGDKEISSVGLSPDNKWLFSSDRGDVWVWNLETKSVAWRLASEDAAVLFDGNREILFTGRSASLGLTAGQIAFLNLVDGRVIRILRTAIKEPVKRLVNAKSKNELFVLTDGAIVYRLNNQTGEIEQRVSLADLNPKSGANPLHVWYTTDFEVLDTDPIFVVSDRQHTLFVNYLSRKVVILDHQSMVGIKFNPTGRNFALLGGVKDGSLAGVPPQHYWTVSLFSFRPF